MKNIFILLSMILVLQGCTYVAGATAGATSIDVAYDHRKVEQAMRDQRIVNAIENKFRAEPDLTQNSHVNVACFNQVVLLTGEATTPNYRKLAEALAREVPNVKRIYNEIVVKGPTSSLTRASDSWITTKVKTEMLATDGLKSSSIKVVTENGTVYLMGEVNPGQAEIAVNIARQVAGVQRVVKMFQAVN
jgi:osmotically-inducible protein OsmY